MFRYNTQSTLYINSQKTNSYGEKLYLAAKVINLPQDCSSIAVGEMSTNSSGNIDELYNMLSCLANVLTRQYGLKKCEEAYSWKFILSAPAAWFGDEERRWRDAKLLGGLADKLAMASRNVHDVNTVGWTGGEFTIKVFEVSKNTESVPILPSLPEDLTDYTYQLVDSTSRSSHIPVARATTDELEMEWD